MNERVRGFLIGLLSVVASAAATFVCIQHQVLWVWAPIPALVGIMYHLLNLQPRYQNRVDVAGRYRLFLAEFQKQWSKISTASEKSDEAAEDLSAHQPRFSSTLWAAALLTAVLSVPAAFSSGGVDLAFGGPANATGVTDAKPLSEPAKGLVFAGLGVYALIILRTIGRVNSGGLHARFMITAALRGTIAMALGYFAGAANFFATFPIVGGTAYFLVGLCYPLFVEKLHDEAAKLFSRKSPVTEPMPLQMVDGIDDDVADILTELGITDVQHLAASDPAVLTVRSLYPFERVVDWINQAMLIRRFRERIADLRQFNIRGIVDWIPLMEPIEQNTRDRSDSEAVLAQIADAVKESVEAIRVFGRAAYRDYKANVFWRLWQHRLELVAPAFEPPAVTDLGPRIAITGPAGPPMPAQVLSAVDTLVVEELRRLAADAATKFRAENPDAAVPADDYVQANYQTAFAAALQRATLAANPKPGSRTRTVYEEAFRQALD